MRWWAALKLSGARFRRVRSIGTELIDFKPHDFLFLVRGRSNLLMGSFILRTIDIIARTYTAFGRLYSDLDRF